MSLLQARQTKEQEAKEARQALVEAEQLRLAQMSEHAQSQRETAPNCAGESSSGRITQSAK